MAWRPPTCSALVVSLLKCPPTANTDYDLIVVFSSQTTATKGQSPSLSFYFVVDKFNSQKEAAKFPLTFHHGRVSFPMNHPVPMPTIGWLLHFLGQTPLSLFDEYHFGTSHKWTDASERKPNSLQPAHTHGGAVAQLFGGSVALPMETEWVKPLESGRRLLILVVVCV